MRCRPGPTRSGAGPYDACQRGYSVPAPLLYPGWLCCRGGGMLNTSPLLQEEWSAPLARRLCGAVLRRHQPSFPTKSQCPFPQTLGATVFHFHSRWSVSLDTLNLAVALTLRVRRRWNSALLVPSISPIFMSPSRAPGFITLTASKVVCSTRDT